MAASPAGGVEASERASDAAPVNLTPFLPSPGRGKGTRHDLHPPNRCPVLRGGQTTEKKPVKEAGHDVTISPGAGEKLVTAFKVAVYGAVGSEYFHFADMNAQHAR